MRNNYKDIIEESKMIEELDKCEDKSAFSRVKKKYANSTFLGKKSIRLLNSLEQLAFYVQVVLFALFLFLGTVLNSEKIVFLVFDLSIVSFFFLLFFSLSGLSYVIYKSIKSKANCAFFIISSILRIVISTLIILIEIISKLLSIGGLFNV